MLNGQLKKLMIEAYKDAEFNKKDSDSFTFPFNPTSYNLKHEVEYDSSQGIGTSGAPLKFKKTKPQELKLDFVLDGTGTASSSNKSVDDQIRDFLKVAHEYKGDEHKPRYLKVVWGTLLFKCVMKSADVTHSLFKPDGTLLRAKISAIFVGFVEDNFRAAKENSQSPDLTHVRQTNHGDFLPLLTDQIYSDSTFYLEVANANKLKNFRKLKPGVTLIFPPIQKAETE